MGVHIKNSFHYPDGRKNQFLMKIHVDMKAFIVIGGHFFGLVYLMDI